MENICDQFPVVMPFVPTAAVVQKMIKKAGQLKTVDEILLQINPKELKRVTNDQDLDEPIYEPYCSIRVLPRQITYPTIVDNYPGFFQETSLMHLCEKYMPRHLRQQQD